MEFTKKKEIVENIHGSWFNEKEVLWPGQRMCLKVTKLLVDKKTKFQHVQVFDSETYGRVLILDGVIQLTERDECAYQEMITHIPMFTHPNPKRVLIVGGGDGGVLREVCRHSVVEEVVMCEIDKEVVEIAKEYFSQSTATAFDDPRLTLLFQDAADFMATRENYFDVIIVDSSDPIGPASTLFEESFFCKQKRALRDGGIICSQAECMWLHLDLISKLVTFSRRIFDKAEYCFTCIPTYPSGQIGFLLCFKSGNSSSCVNLGKTGREIDDEVLCKLRYYNTEMHTSAFLLPQFLKKELEEKTG